MQQATLNMLADMGVQPATRQSDLVSAGASPTRCRVTTITITRRPGRPDPGATPVTITGTAADAGGGQVAWVEVSVDDGMTWKRATGTTSWSCVVSLPSPLGQRTIRARGDRRQLQPRGQRSEPHRHGRRRADAVLDLEQRRHRRSSPSSDDSNPSRSASSSGRSTDGFVTGVRFYKGAGQRRRPRGQPLERDRHEAGPGHVRQRDGLGVADVSFPPVAVSAGATYVASVHMPQGHYARDVGLLPERRRTRRGRCVRSADGEDGGNGVFRYGRRGFPRRRRRGQLLGRRRLRRDDHRAPTVVERPGCRPRRRGARRRSPASRSARGWTPRPSCSSCATPEGQVIAGRRRTTPTPARASFTPRRRWTR